MGLSIESFSDGVLTVKVSGQLTATEWQAGQAAAVTRLRESPGKASVLVTVEDFRGWDRGGWDDSPHQSQFNGAVDRLAIVGDRKWEDLALMFVGAGVRRMEIQYFATADAGAAREWLSSKV